MRPTLERSILVAAAATAVASVALAASAWRAVDVPAPEPEPFVFAAPDEAAKAPEFRALPNDAVTLIADNEPFREDREPAPLAYRMPGDRPPQRTEREEEPPPEPPSFVVLGTVTTAEGGIAVIRTSESLPPLFVNVNESVGGYRLVSVASDGAMLSRDDQTFNLAVADPALLREQPESRGRSNNDRRRAEQEREEAAREALEQQTERLRNLMEQARENGGTVFFGPGGEPARPGTRQIPNEIQVDRIFVERNDQGDAVIIQEDVQPNGQVRQRVIAVPRNQRPRQ